MDIFGCYEVTIGCRDTWHGGGYERVDFMTYDTRGEFRLYEIKVSKSDFNSSAKKTFCGDYNYFVMPEALYCELGGKEYFDNNYSYKDIGIILYDAIKPCIRQAKRKTVQFNTRADMLESMLKSMFREEKKLYDLKPYWE